MNVRALERRQDRKIGRVGATKMRRMMQMSGVEFAALPEADQKFFHKTADAMNAVAMTVDAERAQFVATRPAPPKGQPPRIVINRGAPVRRGRR